METPLIVSHVSVAAKDFKQAKDFYTEVLATIGVTFVVHLPHTNCVSFGKAYTAFWIRETTDKDLLSREKGSSVSFVARRKDEVDAFYNKALELGATSAREPQVRKDYGAGCYSAVVIDHNGHRLEVICWDEFKE